MEILPSTTDLTRIRVETALSRFPIHRLARKGNIIIDLQTFNDSGEAMVRWEVSPGSKHGQPGPLAYKIDTLVINRRIDQCRRPLPEVIRIGSLSSICSELGLADAGSNITDVKRALHQNASAYITANIRYKLRTGREKWTEIGYTRYSVIFTGEVLPDGRQADAVYIVLNASYRELLNQVEVRPLDYDYLVALAPGPQRLYELLSFPMYGALLNDRPNARLLYSMYCLHAPQARYLTFDQVKKQMYKVHLPHRESGYIENIEYRSTTDREGKPDWEILYTPGPKAYREHGAFANRGPVALLPEPGRSPEQQSLALADGVDSDLVAELVRRGVTEKRARILASRTQNLAEQIEYVDYLIAQAPRKFHNPSGFYVRFLEDNAPVPAQFLSSAKRRQIEDAEQQAHKANVRECTLRIAYDEYCAQAVDHQVATMPNYENLVTESFKEHRRQYKHMTDAQIREVAANTVRAKIRETLLGFAEWVKQTGGYQRIVEDPVRM